VTWLFSIHLCRHFFSQLYRLWLYKTKSSYRSFSPCVLKLLFSNSKLNVPQYTLYSICLLEYRWTENYYFSVVALEIKLCKPSSSSLSCIVLNPRRITSFFRWYKYKIRRPRAVFRWVHFEAQHPHLRFTKTKRKCGSTERLSRIHCFVSVSYKYFLQ